MGGMDERAHSQITFHEVANGAACDGVFGGVVLIILDPINANAASFSSRIAAVSTRLLDQRHVMALRHLNHDLAASSWAAELAPSALCRRRSALS